jgi:hypothetical protein
MTRLLNILLFVSIFIGVYSCSDPISNITENKPPDTHLTLFPDSIIAPGSTLKTINWWGDDPDGFVAGFYFSFDNTLPVNQWSYTTKYDSTFLLSMNGTDSTFRFYVAAVDDKGLIDPTPASNLFPTINSPPTMQFVSGTDIPDTIYPIATFTWTATDPDGDQTLRNFYWSLNDTLHFHKIPASSSIMTLNKDSGLVLNSNNALYMRVQDNAGSYSKTVRMPSDSTKFFLVKKVNARVLLIKDMPLSEMPAAGGYFSTALDTVKFDSLDIKSGNGKFIPKIINPMFVETIKLFPVVIWSADRGNSASDNANYDLAQRSIPYYTSGGGKIFFTTGFPNAESQSQGQLINFASIDSITYCTIPFVGTGVNLININSAYPVLIINGFIQRVRGIKAPASIPVLYRIPNSTPCQDSTIVAVKNSVNNPNVILMSMPVYFINGDINASKTFFRKILFDEFGLQKIK